MLISKEKREQLHQAFEDKYLLRFTKA